MEANTEEEVKINMFKKEKEIGISAIFAIAFAFVEAAVVVYLRHLSVSIKPVIGSNEALLLLPGIAFLEPHTSIKIITDSSLLRIEQIREAATMVMLLCISFLATKMVYKRIAYFLFAFSVWDIFYYIFLYLSIGWPKTLFDLDVFFLLPVPWVGPVISPIIAFFVIGVLSVTFLLKYPFKEI